MPDSDNKYLIFQVEGRTFCICFSDVLLIVPAQEAKKIPDFPDYITGTIVSEGKTVTVIDLRKRFMYKHEVKSEHECIMICDGAKSIGLLCDSISGFVEVQPDEIQPPPDINEQINARFIGGTFLYEGEPCYMIKPELIVKPDDEGFLARLPELLKKQEEEEAAKEAARKAAEEAEKKAAEEEKSAQQESSDGAGPKDK